MPAIQVVLFDLGGTLIHYDQPPDRSFEMLNDRAVRAFLTAAGREGTRVPDPQIAVRAVARMGAAAGARAARANYASAAEDILREGLEAVGIKPGRRAWTAGLAAYYAEVSHSAVLADGDVRQALALLVAQGRSLGLVSNTVWSPELHDADLDRFGLLEYLPVRVYSSVAGITKPHPNIYRQALDRLDVAPLEAVFVGDTPAVDVAGPQKIGMRAILVSSPYRTETDPEIHPDALIGRIDELPALLEEWDRAIEEHIPV